MILIDASLFPPITSQFVITVIGPLHYCCYTVGYNPTASVATALCEPSQTAPPRVSRFDSFSHFNIGSDAEERMVEYYFASDARCVHVHVHTVCMYVRKSGKKFATAISDVA